MKDLQQKQDQHAQTIGVATIEFLGRALDILSQVQKTREEQLNLGKLVLRAHGVDPDKADCSIDMNDGSIKQLVVRDGMTMYVDIGTETIKE